MPLDTSAQITTDAGSLPVAGCCAVTSEARREVVERWAAAARPYGIAGAAWLMMDQPGDDPGQPPYLDIWTAERDDVAYILTGPLRPDADPWGLALVGQDGDCRELGLFLRLEDALNRVRPVLLTG